MTTKRLPLTGSNWEQVAQSEEIEAGKVYVRARQVPCEIIACSFLQADVQ